jgi:hypothetical protein
MVTAQLYVSADLRWFAADASDRLAYNLTQGDEDGVRAYRRADRFWWAWLARRHAGDPRLAELREILVCWHGADRVALAEATVLGFGYEAPTPLRHRATIPALQYSEAA